MRQTGLGLSVAVPEKRAPVKSNPPAAKFEELAMPLLESSYNLARWYTRNDQDAEDLVQETYLKALRGFQSFQPDTNFRAWIYRILRNTFLTSRTGLRATLSISLDSEYKGPELAIESETPETILMRYMDSQFVQEAIEDLPVYYKEVLIFCDVEEMSYRQIAEMLSIPIGTVMSRLARARKLVRAYLHSSPENRPSVACLQ
jgi:RNA polymerase sigma-70 factor, ECF subfamily